MSAERYLAVIGQAQILVGGSPKQQQNGQLAQVTWFCRFSRSAMLVGNLVARVEGAIGSVQDGVEYATRAVSSKPAIGPALSPAPLGLGFRLLGDELDDGRDKAAMATTKGE